LSDSAVFDPPPRITYRMSSFVSRGAVLASARLLNQALALLSPLLLVRLLEISEYGRYRQFMVTAMFITSLAGFALSANLNYLIARTPQRQAVDISNTCLLMLAVSILSALVVVLARQWIVPPEIENAWLLLAVYVFLFLNLEVLVSYWLAHGQSVQVMGYTLAVTAWRIATLLAATYWLQDVEMIFVTVVCAEAVKNLWIYVWLRRRGLLVFRLDGAAMREQIRLVTPLGAGSVLYKLNDFGKVVVGNQMGPVPLAIYTTAAYQVPLVNIVQGALADVIFPDMVKRSQRDPSQGLLLWKRAQVLVFATICPAWVLLTYWAEPVVRLLFTDAYVAATPYFQVFLLLMIRQCFLFSTPLRSVEDNKSFAHANLIALFINAGFIIALMPKYGLWGPTLGLVVGQTWTSIYLGSRVLKRFQLPLSGLCQWGKLGLALAASLVALAALHASQIYLPPTALGALLGLGSFALVYALAARIILREEYGYVMRAILRRKTA
jgi:O-antigen/teichoic acid export membrane protein